MLVSHECVCACTCDDMPANGMHMSFSGMSFGGMSLNCVIISLCTSGYRLATKVRLAGWTCSAGKETIGRPTAQDSLAVGARSVQRSSGRACRAGSAEIGWQCRINWQCTGHIRTQAGGWRCRPGLLWAGSVQAWWCVSLGARVLVTPAAGATPTTRPFESRIGTKMAGPPEPPPQ